METLGIVITALGFMVTVLIYMKSYDNRSKNVRIPVAICAMGVSILTENYILCLPCIALIGILVAQLLKSQENEASKIIGGTALDRFFVECVLAEVNHFDNAKNKQRAQLIADKYHLKYPQGIEKLYQQGLEAHKAVSQQFVEKRIETKRAEERQEFERLNKYSDLTGKDKRIAMLRDRAAELQRAAKNQEQYTNMLIRSVQEKERDWAIWGGAASGIAGFGAGVSTAADVQLKNMQIRADNQKRLQAAMPTYMAMTGSAQKNRQNAEAIWKEIEGIKLKLMADDKADELLRKIAFSNTDVLVSETGAAMVCTLASIPPKFKIFGDVPAVVDGTIIAKIYDGNQLCGTAQLVLPVCGLGQNIPLNGICIDCCKPGKTYSVKFVAKNLWAMEA